jgi:hypothetical protein
MCLNDTCHLLIKGWIVRTPTIRFVRILCPTIKWRKHYIVCAMPTKISDSK